MAEPYMAGFILVFVFALIRDPLLTIFSFGAGFAACLAYGAGA